MQATENSKIEQSDKVQLRELFENYLANSSRNSQGQNSPLLSNVKSGPRSSNITKLIP